MIWFYKATADEVIGFDTSSYLFGIEYVLLHYVMCGLYKVPGVVI